MAHFAEIDSDNTVLRVIVVNDNDCLDEAGNESESKGIEFCKSLFGQSTNWVQTSYNDKIRGYYAGRGHKYDSATDSFTRPSPYPSWVLNPSTKRWEAPVAKPDDGKDYVWIEFETAWVLRHPVDDGKYWVRDTDSKKWVEATL
tara:strand:- start:110 stop:541 length:432 start_codon:yes stop_codon:yes gene_type:complete